MHKCSVSKCPWGLAAQQANLGKQHAESRASAVWGRCSLLQEQYCMALPYLSTLLGLFKAASIWGAESLSIQERTNGPVESLAWVISDPHVQPGLWVLCHCSPLQVQLTVKLEKQKPKQWQHQNNKWVFQLHLKENNWNKKNKSTTKPHKANSSVWQFLSQPQNLEGGGWCLLSERTRWGEQAGRLLLRACLQSYFFFLLSFAFFCLFFFSWQHKAAV